MRFFSVTFLYFFVLIFLFEYFLDFCAIPLSAAYIHNTSIFVVVVLTKLKKKKTNQI